MPVTAKLSRRVYEQLGDDVANAIVEWFNAVDSTYKADLRELNEVNFARFDAKMGERFARFDERISRFEASVGERISRFEVSVAWHTGSASGVGKPEALTDDSGYFWFFDPSNPELLVKVIDGTAVNGHFWVFLGGLSDVDYTVTVTDRGTDRVRTYTNPRGTVGSRADTSAF